jgi:hypothetical protein
VADRIRKVSYYYTMVPHRPGRGAKVLAALKGAKVNLLAFSGFPSGAKAQLDFVPEDGAAFVRAARQAGVQMSKRKTAFLIDGGDRIGACAGVIGKLAAAKIGVTAMDAVAVGGGRYGAILWVKPKDVSKAAKLLGAK